MGGHWGKIVKRLRFTGDPRETFTSPHPCNFAMPRTSISLTREIKKTVQAPTNTQIAANAA